MNVQVGELAQIAEKKGLKKIALNDSFVKGKRAKLDLNGHTHFFGENGAGKTSTIMLIPLFYGLRPERIVSRQKGSFFSYYLPTTRSFIAYEYLREDGPCTTIIFANKSRDGALYRLMKGGFEETILSERFNELLDELKNISDVLKKLSTDPNYEISRQIDSYTDYAAIIGNLKTRLARKNGLFAEMLRFSLCESHRKLDYMAELSFISVGGKDLHANLTKMVSSIFNIDKLAIGDAPQDAQLPELVSSIRTLHKFRQSRHKFDHGIQLGHATESLYADLLFYQQRAIELNAQFGAEISEANNKRIDLEALHVARLDDLNQQQLSLRTHQLNTQAQLDVVFKRLQNIQQSERHYQQSGIENKRHEYKNLELLKNKLDDAEKHLTRLRSENADIQSEHLRNTEEQRLETQAHVDEIEKQKQLNWQQENQRSNEYRKAESELQSKFSTALKLLRRDTEQSMQLAQADADAANYTMGNSVAQTEEEKEQLAQYAKQLQEALTRVKQAGVELNQAREQLLDAERQDRQKHAAGESLKNRIEQATERLDWLKNILYPKDTLLSALRKNLPAEHYADAISLIDKSLLRRTDIKLEPVEASDLFFGCSVDLSQVSAPIEAQSEDELLQRINDQRAVIEDLQAESQTLSREITQHAQLLKTYIAQQAQHQNALNKAEDAVVRIQHVTNEQRLKVDAAIQQRLQAAQKAFAAAKQRLFDQQKANQKAEKELTQQFDLQKTALLDDFNRDLQQLLSNRQRLDANIVEVRQAGAVKLDELNALYHDKLAKRGVDVAVLQKAEQGLQATKAEYNRVNGYHVEIQAYEDWLATVFVNKQLWMSEQQEVNRTLEQIQSQLSALENSRKELVAEFNRNDRVLQDGLAESKKRLAAVALVIEQVQRNITDVIQVQPSELVVENYELFIDAAETAISHYRRNLNELSKLIQVVNAIVNAERESLQYDEWEKRKSQYIQHRDKSNYDLLMVRELEDMLLNSIPLYEQNARTTFISTYQRVDHYFGGLREFKNKVAIASRRLCEDIRLDNPLKEITGLNLSIKAVVDESTPVYAQMKALKRVYEDSALSRSRDSDEVVCLPDEAMMTGMLATMRSLIGINYGGRGKNDLIDLRIELYEKGNYRLLNSDASYAEVSSTGITKFVILLIFTALARYLNDDENLMIHLPCDELGVLDVDKSISLFSMLYSRNIYIASAQPHISAYLDGCFNQRYQVDIAQGYKTFVSGDEVLQPEQNPLLQQIATEAS